MSETKRQGYLKPIPPDTELEKMDKKSMGYKYRQRRLSCITCFNTATQMMCYDIEGATIIERYCDNCVSKMTNQSTSGI